MPGTSGRTEWNKQGRIIKGNDSADRKPEYFRLFSAINYFYPEEFERLCFREPVGGVPGVGRSSDEVQHLGRSSFRKVNLFKIDPEYIGVKSGFKEVNQVFLVGDRPPASR